MKRREDTKMKKMRAEKRKAKVLTAQQYSSAFLIALLPSQLDPLFCPVS